MGAMVIVGAGECGARTAMSLRTSGWTGDIALLGSENWLPYERPPLSKAAMLAEDAPQPVTVYREDDFAGAGVIHRGGVHVDRIDRDSRQVVLSTGETIDYHKVLLATGASPRALPSAAGFDTVHMLRTHDDAVRLRTELTPGARVTVVGGGFIGLELAASAAVRGCAVTVLEMAPRILGRAVPAEVAAIVDARHREAGVDIRCGVQLAGITEIDRVSTVTLADGTAFESDVLVIGIGAVPETAVAEKSGLDVDNGIRVDGHLATSDPDIFAAGDCCSFPHPLFGGRHIRLEAWRNAQDQAVVAASNMCGGNETYAAVPWFWSDQFDLGLQVAGMPGDADRQVVRIRPDGVEIRYGLDVEGRLVSAAAVGTGNAVAKDIRLAEMMIAERISPDPTLLADPTVNTKTLLR